MHDLPHAVRLRLPAPAAETARGRSTRVDPEPRRPPIPDVFFWPLFGVFFVALLWLGVVPQARADTLADGTAALRVQGEGEFRSTLDKARESALEAARTRLAATLHALKPAIDRVPDVEALRDLVVTERVEDEELSSREVMYKMTLDVQLGPRQIRTLRQQERAMNAAWFLSGVSLLLGMGSLFIRFDEWTKGYLTRWLIAAGVGVTAVLAWLWWFVK